MKQSTPIQMSVPQPCHEDWNKMTPQQQGRFCDVCKKCVVDFTTFTDEQLYKYITTHTEEKICGRFIATQLNRPIHLPHQPHSQLYKWIIAAGLALVLSTTPSTHTFAQAPVQQEKTLANKNRTSDTISTTDTFTVKGKVLDEEGFGAINAIVELKTGEKIIGGSVTNFDGEFNIKSNIHENMSITVKYVGYKTATFSIVRDSSLKVQLEKDPNIQLDKHVILGYVVPLIDESLHESSTKEIHSTNSKEKRAKKYLNHGSINKTITSDELKRMPY